MQTKASVENINKKRILIVNNNMKVGGIQKSLLNLLYEISPYYDITLYLLNNVGEYLEKVPKNVRVVGCTSPFKYFGMSQAESKKRAVDYLCRSLFAASAKVFGRGFTTRIISVFSKRIKDEYDCAISFMHDGGSRLLYGGCNDFVISKVKAKKKITFLHCDYEKCGTNFPSNNKIYDKFDVVAACSDGCKKSFLRAIPHLGTRTQTVINCHNFSEIKELSSKETVCYDDKYTNVIIVARLAHEKGIERALHALKNALDKNINVKLHIVGNGDLMNTLQEMCRELDIENDVVFYGSQTNPYRYIKNADLLFIPSYHEAAPLVIDEAVCLGVPVLSTATTSSEDMILNRNCGWVCENNQTSINEAFFDIVSSKDEILEKKKAIENRGPANNSLALEMIEKILAE